MTFGETFTTIAVLVGLFFLAYSSIRQQGLIDTVNEIKAMFQDKAAEAAEKANLKYAN